MMYCAFYKYREPVKSFAALKKRLIHELTCLLTRSQYSHVELVFKRQNDYECWSSSGRDGGVRRKIMQLPANRWDLVPVVGQELRIKKRCMERGGEYDYWGALRAVIPCLQGDEDKWYCSEYVADVLGLDESNGRSPQSLYIRLKKYIIIDKASANV